MRTPLFVVPGVLILCITALDVASEQAPDATDFSVNVRPLSREIAIDLPMPIEIKVTYIGHGEIKIAPLSEQSLTIQPPNDWELSDKQGWITSMSPQPISLANGQSTSVTVNLHRFFKKMVPGRVEIPITVRIWPGGKAIPLGRGMEVEIPKEIALRTVVKMEIGPADPVRLEKLIRATSLEIDQEKNSDKRLQLFQSLDGLSAPELIEFYVKWLSDPTVGISQFKARLDLIRLSETYKNWHPVVSFLVAQGSEYDSVFFEHWKVNRAQLTDAQIVDLTSSPRWWTRLYTLELRIGRYGKGPWLDAEIHSLEGDLAQRSERLRRLKQSLTEGK